MNKIAMKTYIYLILLTVFMQGCDRGEAATVESEATTVDEEAITIIGSSQLLDSAITTAKLAAGAVTNAKIENGAVTEAKLAAGAVTNAKIENGAVTEGKIADNAVTSAKIKNGAVTSAKIKDGAVTDEKIAGDIQASKITVSNYNELLDNTATIANLQGVIADLRKTVLGLANLYILPVKPTHIEAGTLSDTDGEEAVKAIDGNYNTSWVASANTINDHIQVTFPYKLKATSFTVQGRNGQDSKFSAGWKLEVSNDGSTWNETSISPASGTIDGVAGNDPATITTYQISEDNAYTHWRISDLDKDGTSTSSTHPGIAELQFYGSYVED